MSTPDVPLLSAEWSDPDPHGVAARQAFLESVAPVLAAPLAVSVAQLHLSNGCRVLDAGCGTGIAAVEMASLVGPDGQVIAVDVDPAMVAATAARPGAERVDARVGDVLALDLVDDAVDAARVERVLTHLLPDGADAAVAELVRVTRRRGRVVVLEPEMHQVSVDAAEPTRALLRAAAAQIANPRAGLRARAALLDAGCDEVSVTVAPLVVTDLATFLRLNPLDQRAAELAAAGIVDEHEAREAVADLRARDTAGRFLSVHLIYVTAGTVM